LGRFARPDLRVHTSGTHVVVALALFTFALLVRPVVDALEAVFGPVVAAATARRPAKDFVS
jgi:hypothetical protein